MTNGFYYLWGLVFGLIFGSFANVLIARDKARASIWKGRSRCPHCHHPLAWYDLIPVASFVLLAGRCRYCRRPISRQYPLVELAVAALALLSIRYGLIDRGSLVLTAGLFTAGLLLVVVSVIDILTMEVPLEYCLAAGAIGGGAMLASHSLTIAQAGWGVVAGAGTLAAVLYGWKLLFHQDGMGAGDIWLAGSLGAVVGYPLVWVSLMAAVMLGAFVGIGMLMASRGTLKTPIPFGPFLFLGALLSLQVGQMVIDWYIL